MAVRHPLVTLAGIALLLAASAGIAIAQPTRATAPASTEAFAAEVTRANALIAQGRIDEANDALMALKTHPQLPSAALNNYAVALAAVGRTSEARQALQMALEADATTRTVYRNLVRLNQQLAETAYKRALGGRAPSATPSSVAQLELVPVTGAVQPTLVAAAPAPAAAVPAAPSVATAVAPTVAAAPAAAASAPATTASAPATAAKAPAPAPAASAPAPTAAATAPRTAAAPAPAAVPAAPGVGTAARTPAPASTPPATAAPAVAAAPAAPSVAAAARTPAPAAAPAASVPPPATIAAAAKMPAATTRPPVPAAAPAPRSAPAAATAAAPPPVAPTPSVAASAATASAATAGAASTADSDAAATVRAWADAWHTKNTERYLSYYSAAFQPAGGLTHPQWLAQRKERVAPSRQYTLEIDNLAVTTRPNGQAVAVFRQRFVSPTLNNVVRKELVLRREGDAWKIVSEKVIG